MLYFLFFSIVDNKRLYSNIKKPKKYFSKKNCILIIIKAKLYVDIDKKFIIKMLCVENFVMHKG